MKIQSISSNQQTYKGYVGKSFTDYVHTASRNECMNLLERANKHGQKIDVSKVLEINSFATKIISKFSKYMEYLERNTCLNISDVEALTLNNPISKKGITFTRPMLKEEKAYLASNCIISPAMYNHLLFLKEDKEAGMQELKMLDSVASDLMTIDYESIDKSFLKWAEEELKEYTEEYGANFFKRLKARNMAENIDNYAQRIGEEPVNKVRVEEYIRIAKEQKAAAEQTKLEKEQIKEENIKIVNEILNS